MAVIKDLEFDKCQDINCVEAIVKVDEEGHLLKIPVYLEDICPFREIIVGVQVYIGGNLYAMKTKKVFTGGRPYCRKIRRFYAGDFYFLFTDTCSDDICIHVLAHYIYEN